MKIAIIGAGHVGGTLGRAWVGKGHAVCFGVRNPQDAKVRALLAEAGPGATALSVAEAAKAADVVVLATPWSATEAAVRSAGPLDDKIVIDATNPLNEDFSALTLGHTVSAAEQVASWAPGARVFKAFNTTGFGNMANPQFPGGKAVMFVCGDDPEGKRTVLDLAAGIGFDAVDAGGLVQARLLEPLAMLWIGLAFGQGFGTDFAFGLLRR
jgi:8-hydroxy-5-deazaflavin:NADPH oxidoreductase